ncbi:MAG TPA: hypothetical protein VGC79_20155, partial [Polyangiaceae bacterium]
LLRRATCGVTPTAGADAQPRRGPGALRTRRRCALRCAARALIWARCTEPAARGTSAWALGRFRTPRADRIRFAWSDDTCGQGLVVRIHDLQGREKYKTDLSYEG